ncbi:PREDICTED: uncharacterized protein LOC106628023 isoform X2 [Pseudopodoces humilis]|uniref:uncharacterized protein LOC106628023 isoform X2 n=1 Tax=Pseudopodoces humilis TaxID=181119 RepID=UPI0006B75F31|nr:PREDICTED: uncharacterized protein LOC106628023 isoform X2 [Pseudopodoces humilis]
MKFVLKSLSLQSGYPSTPFNLKLKPRHLNIDPELEPLKGKQKDSDRRFFTYKPYESKWDPQLLLPKSPWPPTSALLLIHLLCS